jgi:ABC-2 type transport system ATP-binding protein
MLLGLVKPSGGRFEVLGVPARAAGARARLGFLPEQPYFPAQLTAAEAMRLYGRLTGVGRAALAEQSAELLDRVGLDGRQKTLLSKFSRGMLQRLGLAQALLGSPEVLVLDEPASGLDPVGQRDIRNLMLELKEQGVTILLSSHQLSEVENVSDEVTILNRGRVAARGHIDDLLSVAGETSIAVRGEGELPSAVVPFMRDEAVRGNSSVFSVADEHVRQVVDALDDGGWRLVSVSPKRDSLEDYFARLLGESSQTAGAPGTESASGGDR